MEELDKYKLAWKYMFGTTGEDAIQGADTQKDVLDICDTMLKEKH